MNLDRDHYRDWMEILQKINKDQIPVELMDRVLINLKDGSTIEIDIVQLLDNGISVASIEKHLNSKFEDLDSIIRDVDFHINVDAVIESVQPATNKALKDL